MSSSVNHKPMDVPARRNCFDILPSDLVVSVLSFLSVRDVSQSACCDRRTCYLVYKLQRARPELIVSVLEDTDSTESSISSGSSGSTAVELGKVFRRGLSQLSGRPNVAFAFFPVDRPPVDRQQWLRAAQRYLPSDTALLVAGSHATHASAGVKLSDETNPKFSLMLGAFPEAHVCPFNTSDVPSADDTIQQALRKATPSGVDMTTFWKVFVVYADPDGSEIVEANVRALQKQFPHASIIGGLCLEGESRFVGHCNDDGDGDDDDANAASHGGGGGAASGSDTQAAALPFSESDVRGMKISELKTLIRKSMSAADAARALKDVIEKADLVTLALSAVAKRARANADAEAERKARELNQVFGVALGGNVPLRSIVSRGASSIFQRDVQQGGRAFNFRVRRSSVHVNTYHRIDSIDVLPHQAHQQPGPMSTTPSVPATTPTPPTTTVSGSQFIIEYGLQSEHGTPRFSPQFVGVQRPGEDGYLLYQLAGDCLHGESLILPFDGDDEDAAMSIEDASIDLFGLDAESAAKDLDATLKALKGQLEGQKLLGALMFSCTGRMGMLQNGMIVDPSKFANTFPGLPCLGFYAMGEIGPKAKVGNKNVFQEGQAALQGFTAVFGVFVVPAPTDFNRLVLDDRPEKIQEYLRRITK